MRYVLLDRITGLEPGRSLTAIKNVSISDGLVTRYGQGLSALPPAMVLESLAQAAGILIAATIDFDGQPVLAKVQPFTAYRPAVAGDQVTVRADIEEMRREGGRVLTTAKVGDDLIADATVYIGIAPLEPGREAQRRTQMRAHMTDTFPGWFEASRPVEVSS